MLGPLPMSPKEFSDTMTIYLDFHRTYLFRVMFFDSGSPTALVSSLATGALTTQLISATDTPISTTGAINLGWQGSKLKIAGKTDYQDWKVTIRDDAINVAYTYFQDWRSKVYNLSSGKSSTIAINPLLIGKAGYKKSAIIILLANKIIENTARGVTALKPLVNALGVGATTRAYLLYGIWPKEVGAITLDYSTEGITTFPVTFSVDYFEPYSTAGLISSIL